MKKLTILFSILIASISAYAASTLQITLSSASQADKVLQIIVDTPFSDAYDNGYDATIGANQEGGLYICSGTERYSLWATNAIAANLPMGFGSVADDDYTLSFQYFTGAAFEIYDRTADKTITVNSASNILIDGVAADPANKYTFTLGTGEAHNAAINDRFVFNYDPALASVTTNAHGLATFSFNQDVVAAETGVKLYKGQFNGYNESLALAVVDGVLANKGVIVYGEPNTTYHFVAGTVNSTFNDDDLLASSEWQNRDQANSIYVLSGNELYLYEGTDFPANKAFLELPANTPAPRRIRLVFDQATAIDNISADNVKAEKVVENGQILIRRGNEVYNLQGQIVK